MKMKCFGVFALSALMGSVGAFAGTHTRQSKVVYVANLHGMNVNAAGHHATGAARFTITGDVLTIDIKMQGLPPPGPEVARHMPRRPVYFA